MEFPVFTNNLGTFLILYFNSRSLAFFFSPPKEAPHSLVIRGWMNLAIEVFAKATLLHHHHSYSLLAHEFQSRWGFKENGKNFSSLRSLERNWRKSWNKVHLGKFSLTVEVFIRSDTPIQVSGNFSLFRSFAFARIMWHWKLVASTLKGW